MLKQYVYSFITSAAGAATLTFPKLVSGLLYSVRVDKGTLDNGADLTVADNVRTLFTATNVSASKTYYPRSNSCSEAGVENADAAILPEMIGPVTVTIAQGGNAASGKVTLRYLD